MGAGKLSFIDKTGALVIPGPFEQASEFHNGIAAVQIKKKWGYIDKTGKIMIPCQFDWAGSFLSQFAPVEKDELVAFIDQTGKTVIPFKFKDAREFSDGLAPATLDGQHWGFIDASGEFLIAPKFKRAFSFSDGLALVYIPARKEIKITPVDLPLVYTSALNMREQEQFNQCRKICLEIQSVDSKSKWAEKARVLLKYRLPDHDLAPDVERAYSDAVVALRYKRFDESARHYRECLTKDPDFPIAAGALAFIYLQENKPDEVVSLLKPILERYPDYARGWCRLAQAYKAQNQKDLAADCMTRARKLDPDDPWFTNE
jgi:tetratricopeptide (TPR) repeat protein